MGAMTRYSKFLLFSFEEDDDDFGFSTNIRNTNKKGNEIKNQLDVGIWIISKVVLNNSHSCCPNQEEMLNQHRQLSMFIRCTIENNEKAEIRLSKTYQSFVPVTGRHRKLSFIKKDVRNYITREVHNVSELEDAKEFGKYLLRMKEKNQNFFFELELEIAFWADARNRTACEYFEDVISFDTTYNTNSMVLGTTSGFQIPIYLDHHFRAGMRSTQRSESIHAFFNKFITQNRSLIQFVKQYDNFLGSRKQTEKIRCCIFSYRHTMCNKILNRSSILACFRKVQAQCRGKVNCITRSTQSALGYTIYEVLEQVSNSTFNKFSVTYNAILSEVKCQCLLFESEGYCAVTL
ncbi:hypothetical protein Ahy_B02g060772 [Arachis hypogaea]|uniref:Uncharacterized protein n=1 Tax=Arachis hypogaea TaxID=3818 RepID=A0A445AJG7_ARAHY|nr:hypothetical protein Ahy_B02g060772 [Arachis hypogaea]